MDTALFDDFKTTFQATNAVRMSLPEYLNLCKTDPLAYALPAERMLRDCFALYNRE